MSKFFDFNAHLFAGVLVEQSLFEVVESGSKCFPQRHVKISREQRRSLRDERPIADVLWNP